MAWYLRLAANFARLIDNANGGLFDRDIQTGIMFHAALLHLMLVAVQLRPRLLSARSAAPLTRPGNGAEPNTPSDSLLVESIGYPPLVHGRDQCCAVHIPGFHSRASWLCRGRRDERRSWRPHHGARHGRGERLSWLWHTVRAGP